MGVGRIVGTLGRVATIILGLGGTAVLQIDQAIAAETVGTISDGVLLLELPGATDDKLDVYVNDLLSHAFVEVVDGTVRLRLPFPDAESFTVTIRARATDEILFTEIYGEPDVSHFDSLEFEFTAQDDAVGRPYDRSMPRINDIDERFVDQLANDYLAAGSVRGAKDQWDFGADLEVIGTNDPAETLRRPNPPATRGAFHDISEAEGFVAYKEEDFEGKFALGDVYVPAHNPLVNEGFSSRGLVFDGSAFDGILTASIGRTFGTDIRGTQHGLGLTTEESNRTAFHVAFKPLREGIVTLKLTGGYFDLTRPDEVGFGFGEIPVGEKNTLFSTSGELGLFDERIRLLVAAAASQYSNPASLDTFGSANLQDIDETEGDAGRIRLDIDLWQGDYFGASVFGGLERVSPFYQALESFVEPDQERIDAGLSLTSDYVFIDLSTEAIHTNIEDVTSILATKQVTYRGATTFELGSLRETYDEAAGDAAAEAGFPWLKLIPSRITIGAEEQTFEGLNGEELVAIPNLFFPQSAVPDNKSDQVSVGFGWDFENASTGIDFYRIWFDDRSLTNESSDSLEHSIGLSQSLFGDIWEVSASVEGNNFENQSIPTFSNEYSLSASAFATVRPEGLPDLTISGDWEGVHTEFQGEGFTGDEQTYQGLATMDFSKFLPSPDLGVDYGTYLRSSYLVRRSAVRDPTFGTTEEWDHTWTIEFGARL